METIKIEMTLKNLGACYQALNEVLNNNAQMEDEREFSARMAVTREEAEKTLSMLGQFFDKFSNIQDD